MAGELARSGLSASCLGVKPKLAAANKLRDLSVNPENPANRCIQPSRLSHSGSALLARNVRFLARIVLVVAGIVLYCIRQVGVLRGVGRNEKAVTSAAYCSPLIDV